MLIYSGFVNHEVSPLGIYIYLSLYYDFFLSSFLHLCFSRNLAESQFSVALTVSARPRREQSNFGSAPRHQRLILRSDCFCVFLSHFVHRKSIDKEKCLGQRHNAVGSRRGAVGREFDCGTRPRRASLSVSLCCGRALPFNGIVYSIQVN